MKKIISLLLSFVMMLSLCNVIIMNSIAVDEAIIATVQGTYTKSELAQDIIIRLELPGVTENYAGFYIDTGIELPDGFVIKSITTSHSTQIEDGDYSKAVGTLNYDPVSSTNSIPAGTYYDVIVTAPANAVGDYTFAFNEVCATDSSYQPIAEAASVTTTLTIKEAPTADYTTSLSADKESINVDETVMVSVTVDGKVGEFASSQLVFAYDTNYLTFDAEGSELNGASASDNDGTITLVDHGDAQNNGVAYQLAFKGKAVTDTDSVITLTSAAFDKETNAPTQNIPIFTPDAATNTVSVAVVEKRYEVTLHEYFQTEDGVLFVEEGGAFTFSAKDPNYKYTVTVNDNAYTAVFNEETGEWTVSDVQDDLTITATRTPKQFKVTIDSLDHITGTPATGENAATYTQDYTFTLKANDTHQYLLESITIGGETAPIESYSNNGKTYTIDGDYITGDIVITTKTEEIATYKINISGASGVLTSSESSVQSDTEVTLTLTPREGYKYTFTLNGTPITMDGNNQYTAKVTENWVVYVTEELDLDEQDVKIGVGENSTYLSLEGKTVYLIQITADVAEGYAYTYDDEIMFWSDEYNNGSYVILVIQDANAAAPTFGTVKTHIKVEQLEQEEEVKTILYTGDVNMAGEDKVDANDAQLVWNIYNGKRYTSFTMLPMEKFLRADVDADGDVDVDDAAKIVTIIQGN